MTTYFLSEETTAAYLRELLDRLRVMSPRPDLICAVTKSGIELLGRLLLDPKSASEFSQLQAISFGKNEHDVLVISQIDESEIKGRNCLLLDSAVHTGRLMNRCRKRLVELGAAEISSYALVLKRGSRHVPTFWGLMIDDLDRALFFLDKIPNNRLLSSGEPDQKHVTISVLEQDSSGLPPVVSGVDSMDRITWSDRIYDMLASPSERFTRTWLLEKSHSAIGYLTTHLEAEGRHLVIDEVALDTAWRGQKLGGVLIRFACTFARHHNCRKVKLNAIEGKVEYYDDFGFVKIPGREPLKLDGETYFPMEKSLINEPLDGHDPEL